VLRLDAIAQWAVFAGRARRIDLNVRPPEAVDMPSNIPRSVAEYYDLNPLAPPDVPFYASLVPSPDATILELGCGTGRVLLPLAQHGGYVHGVDASETMLAICRTKVRQAGIPTTRAEVTIGDVTDFHLRRIFDLIPGPLPTRADAGD
jgi:SAM-dependent methyltransferase